MSGFDFKFDGIQINAQAFDLAEPLQKAALQEITTTVANCKHKSDQGLNADKGKLKSYSPSYQNAIARGWVQGKGAETAGLTNLTQSGALMESRDATQLPDGAQSTFQNQHPPYRHKARKGNRAPRQSHKGGKSAPPSNAQLAGYLMEKGFTNWHAFGQDDLDRIHNTFEQAGYQVLDNSIRVVKAT